MADKLELSRGVIPVDDTQYLPIETPEERAELVRLFTSPGEDKDGAESRRRA